MKQLIGLLLLVALGLLGSSCGTERPQYDLEQLKGSWRRTFSSNIDADSMLLKIDGSSALIIEVPSSSSFSVNELKWTSIQPVASHSGFSLSDKSADGRRYDSKLIVEQVENDVIVQFRLLSEDFEAAPGGDQQWEREQ
jgi:hypothetical protein